MRESGLEEDDQGFRIGGRNLNNLIQYADDTALTAENLEDLRTLIRKVKEQTELQLSMKNTKVMMTGKITNFIINRQDVEMVDSFCLAGSVTHNRGSSTQEI